MEEEKQLKLDGLLSEKELSQADAKFFAKRSEHRTPSAMSNFLRDALNEAHSASGKGFYSCFVYLPSGGRPASEPFELEALDRLRERGFTVRKETDTCVRLSWGAS